MGIEAHISAHIAHGRVLVGKLRFPGIQVESILNVRDCWL